MNTNFFVAEDEVFNPNKVLTRKQMDAFIGDRGIKSYAGVLKKDNKLFYNFIRVKVAEGKNCVDAIYARKAIVSNGCLRNDFFSFGEYNFVAFVTNGKIYCDLKNFFNERFGIESMSYAAGASDALSTLKQPDPKELFIILSYYSNEDDGEFDRVGSCDKVYPTLEAAKAAADKLFKEDKENRPENLAVAYTLDDCIRDIEENPLYVVGEWQKNAFGSYHNFYAVFGVSLTED